MKKRRIYEWMLHYRNVAERRRFRITRWKLNAEQARRFAEECSGVGRFSYSAVTEAYYQSLIEGCEILGIPVVIVE